MRNLEELIADTDKKWPKWTVLYNIANDTKWVGTGWQFFDKEKEARMIQEKLNKEGHCASLRPFNKKCDIPHLGAVHKW